LDYGQFTVSKNGGKPIWKNKMANIKLIRITTVSQSLTTLIAGQCNFMIKNGFDVVAVSAGSNAESEEVKNREKVKHLIIPFTRKITPIIDLWCMIKLMILFHQEKPDIVHTHTPKAGLLGMIAASFMRVPIRIHTLAGLPLVVETGFKRKLLMQIERITYLFATQVWPNSESGKNFILENNLLPENKLSMIGKGSSNGIDFERFNRNNLSELRLEEIKKSLNYSTSNFYILCIGRMVHDKGINELVQTFVVAQQRFSNCKLILVGPLEHDLDPLLPETIIQIENNKSITIILWSDEVEYYLAFSDLLIHPSHREGFPNVMLQAAAIGCPILCSDIPGNTDILPNESFGLHFNVGNVNSLLQNITFAIENKNELLIRAQNLQKRVANNFSQKRIHELIKEKYVELFASKENF